MCRVVESVRAVVDRKSTVDTARFGRPHASIDFVMVRVDHECVTRIRIETAI